MINTTAAAGCEGLWINVSGAASRRRGADAERMVVNWLRGNGYPDARRYLAGDGRQPGDIDAIPGVCIEVKDRKQSAWPTWRAQAVSEAGENRTAVVVRRERGNPNVGNWPCHWGIPTYQVLREGRIHPVDRWWVVGTFATFIGTLNDGDEFAVLP